MEDLLLLRERNLRVWQRLVRSIMLLLLRVVPRLRVVIHGRLRQRHGVVLGANRGRSLVPERHRRGRLHGVAHPQQAGAGRPPIGCLLLDLAGERIESGELVGLTRANLSQRSWSLLLLRLEQLLRLLLLVHDVLIVHLGLQLLHGALHGYGVLAISFVEVDVLLHIAAILIEAGVQHRKGFQQRRELLLLLLPLSHSLSLIAADLRVDARIAHLLVRRMLVELERVVLVGTIGGHAVIAIGVLAPPAATFAGGVTDDGTGAGPLP